MPDAGFSDTILPVKNRWLSLLAGLSFLIFLAIIADREVPQPSSPLPPSTMATTTSNGVVTFEYHAYAYASAPRHPSFHFLGFSIPYSDALLAAAILPTFWVIRRIFGKRQEQTN
jgi:hypothetical protein